MKVLVEERHSCVSHYNPQMGRFLSEDPIGFDSGDYNLYRYVSNNPHKYTDPTEKIAGIIMGGIAIGDLVLASIATGSVAFAIDQFVNFISNFTVSQPIESINNPDLTCNQNNTDLGPSQQELENIRLLRKCLEVARALEKACTKEDCKKRARKTQTLCFRKFGQGV